MSIGKYAFAYSQTDKRFIMDGELENPRKFSKLGNIPDIVGKTDIDNTM